MKISFVLFGLVLLSLCSTSCDNAGRDARKTWDSSPVQEIAHSGKFKGYAAVYTIDWLQLGLTKPIAYMRKVMETSSLITKERITFLARQILLMERVSTH